MNKTTFKWMPHHEGAVPPAGQGKRISTYTIALEGWRRGLQLDFYRVIEEEINLKLRFSLDNGKRKHHFQLSKGDRVTQEAFDICDDKSLTKKYLKKNNVPVPQGKTFTTNNTKDEIGAYADKLGYPVVLKPTDGNAGRGVFANVQNRESLLNLVSYVQEELEFKNIMVERFIEGDEYRIYVIEDRVLGAMIRRPASVLGNGKHTIKQLIRRKNRVRRANPHLKSRLITVDREVIELLHRAGHSLKSIPEEGERVFLRTKSNLSTGGDSIDKTAEVSPEIVKIAVEAGKAIPNLPQYGVDMIVSTDQKTGTVLEVNTRPGIGGHLFPIEGEPRDIAKHIVDYYFPETKNVIRSPLFFDFDLVMKPIVHRQSTYSKLDRPPLGPMYGKELFLTGEFNGTSFKVWARRRALERDLHGNIEELSDGRIRIRIMGADKEKLDEFKALCYLEPAKANVQDIEEHEWNKPIKIGFEIINPINKLTTREIRKLKRSQEKLAKEKSKAIARYERLLNSRTWRYTEPVRKFIKKLLRK